MSLTQIHHIPALPGPFAGSVQVLDDAIYGRIPLIGVLPVARPTRKQLSHF
jgi:hypothetical protein